MIHLIMMAIVLASCLGSKKTPLANPTVTIGQKNKNREGLDKGPGAGGDTGKVITGKANSRDDASQVSLLSSYSRSSVKDASSQKNNGQPKIISERFMGSSAPSSISISSEDKEHQSKILGRRGAPMPITARDNRNCFFLKSKKKARIANTENYPPRVLGKIDKKTGATKACWNNKGEALGTYLIDNFFPSARENGIDIDEKKCTEELDFLVECEYVVEGDCHDSSVQDHSYASSPENIESSTGPTGEAGATGATGASAGSAIGLILALS